MDAPIVHVGFAKTATTTLQRGVFARHSGLSYAAAPERGGADAVGAAMAELRERLQQPLGDGFDVVRCRRLYEERIAPAASSGRPLLLSDEDFSFQGSIDLGLEARRVVGRIEKAERLRALLGPARVILVVRHPIDWMRSLYLQKLRGYGKKYRRIDGFDRWLAAHWDRRDERASHASNLRYFELADAYAQLFGRGNVSVLAYEQLVREPESFMSAAARAAGVDQGEAVRLLRAAKRENATLTRRQHLANGLAARSAAARWALRASELAWLRRAASALTPGRAPLQVATPPALAAAIAEHTRRDNCLLAAEWRLPLGDYGYPV